MLMLDCPWRHRDRRKIRKDGKVPRFGVGAQNKYQTMSTEELTWLPIHRVMAKPSVVFCWGTYPMTHDAMACIKSWGFSFSTIGFDWIKLNVGRARWDRTKLAGMLFSKGLVTFLDWMRFFGVGYWSKSNPEPCWLGTRGKPVLQKVANDISNVVFAPVGKHSAKPGEVPRRIVRMFGPERRYLELFAREKNTEGSALPGWVATGLEYDGLNVWQALEGLAELEDVDVRYGTLSRRGKRATKVADLLS